MKWTKFFFLIYCFLFINIFIWFRFIRERLPMEIPFNLSLFRSSCLILTCFLFCYTIIRYFYPNKNHNYSIVKLIFKPFVWLDNSIKEKNKIKFYYERCFLFFISFFVLQAKKIVYLEYFIRCFTLTVFILDVFCFKYLYFIYKIIYCLIVIYIIKYLIYCLHDTKDKQLILINEKVEVHLNTFTGPIIPLNIFIEQQSQNILKKQSKITYDVWPRFDFIKKKRKELNLKYDEILNFAEIRISAKKTLNLILNINQALFIYERTKSNLRMFNLLFSIFYLICWIYILHASFHTLNITSKDLYFLHNFQDHINPFSQIPFNLIENFIQS